MFTERRSESEWIAQFLADSEVQDIDRFKQTGVYIREQRYRAGLEAFFRDPRANPLKTASGKIEFSSPLWRVEMGAYWNSRKGESEIQVDISADGSVAGTMEREKHFLLITPKVAEYVHSQRVASADRQEPGTVHVHPGDMRSAGVARGDTLELRSGRGSILARVEPDLNLIQGTIWIEEGLWADPEGGIDPKGSPNLLTSVEGTAESVSCIMHGINVSARPHR